MQTGFPLQISQATNYNSIFGYASQRPNATGVSPVTSGSLEDRLNNYINPAAFSTAPTAPSAIVARTIRHARSGPGQLGCFAVQELHASRNESRLSSGSEALNATNTPLFYGPNYRYGSGSFGKITSQANFSRQLQLALRFSF